MTEEKMFALPFNKYLEYRTKFAVKRAKTSRLIDMDYAFLSLLQAMWAKEYWFMKIKGGVK